MTIKRENKKKITAAPTNYDWKRLEVRLQTKLHEVNEVDFR